jgi:hypothetical protein
MTMRFLVVLVAIALVSPTAHAEDKTTGEPPFHPPQTEAETVFDQMLHKNIGDLNLLRYILQTPELKTLYEEEKRAVREYDPRTAEAEYGIFFTPALRKVLAQAEKEAVNQNCGGKYVAGKKCGLNYDPIVCAQHSYFFRGPFVYKTHESDNNEAIISYTAADKSRGVSGPHRMVKDQNVWKLDGVNCGRELFNIPERIVLKPYGFRVAHYEAEKALDAILIQAVDDSYNNGFNIAYRGQPGYVAKKVPVYRVTFSPGLIAAWKKASIGKPLKSGEPCYYPKLCGADYDPVTCATSNPDYFFYRQERANDHEAIVVTEWPGSGKVLGTYKLIKVHAKWKLDGIACNGKDKFNMP